MELSILTSVKKMLGLADDYEAFDLDVITHINSVFLILKQLGVGPENAFSITGDFETWDDFDTQNIAAVRSYIYLRVRMLFDPPATSFAIEANERQSRELEWRLNVDAESN